MPFDSDNWPDEPTEYDPESQWGDPEQDLVSIPSVDIPSTNPATEESELTASGERINGKQARFFIVAVIFANVAVAGIGVGILLIGFRSQWSLGGGGIALGLIALYRTYQLTTRYYQYINDADDDTGQRADASATQPISTTDEDQFQIDHKEETEYDSS